MRSKVNSYGLPEIKVGDLEGLIWVSTGAVLVEACLTNNLLSERFDEWILIFKVM